MTNNHVIVNMADQSMPNEKFAELMTVILAKGIPFRFQAGGFSMVPFVQNGDLITIMPSDTSLHRGDVVAFINTCNQRLTIHRIIRISRNGYLVKGDNSTEADGWITRKEIIGRVTMIEHHGKWSRLGLGNERILIAYLSRRGWLNAVLGVTWRFLRPFVKRV
jgi:signal peptidase I